MKLSKQGVLKDYHGDVILIRWTWVSGKRYHSTLTGNDYDSLAQYWQGVALFDKTVRQSGDKKVIGFSELEIVTALAKQKFAGDCVVILANVNPSVKPSSFWSKLSPQQARSFIQDYVSLVCKDKSELQLLVANTSHTFGDAYGFIAGELVCDNSAVEIL